MKCAECQDLMQQHLDGLEPSNPADLELHLRGCSDCRALHVAVGRLQRGLRLLAPPSPPQTLAGQIAARLQADQRWPLEWRRRITFGLATAAAILLVVFGWLFRPASDTSTPENRGEQTQLAEHQQPAQASNKPAEDSVDLQGSVSDMSSVMVNAATRTTDAAVAESRAFLPLVSSAPLPSRQVPPTMEQPLSLKEAGHGVSDGLSPVTDSARRAVDLFLRDLPPMGVEEKPGL